MSDEKRLDDLAHERFKLDFKKLFGAKPDGAKATPFLGKQLDAALVSTLSKSVRAQFDQADDYSRGLILLEAYLERVTAPAHAARQERVEKELAEAARLIKSAELTSDCARLVITEMKAMGAAAERFAALREIASSPSAAESRDAMSELRKLGNEMLASAGKMEDAVRKLSGAEVRKSAESHPFEELAPLDLDRPMLTSAAEQMEASWTAILTEQRKKARAAAATALKRPASDDGLAEQDRIDEIVAAVIALLDLGMTSTQVNDLTRLLAAVALDAATRTYGQVVGGGEDDASEGEAPGSAELGEAETADLTSATNAWAKTRAAELVDEINSTTREDVREAISEGLADGKSKVGLMALVAALTAFSEARAALIATNEAALANGEGVVQALQRAIEAGFVLKKTWRTVPEVGGPCPVCIANEEAGALDVEATFPSGDQAPPGHPNCRCLIVPLLRREAGKVSTPARRVFH